jgi:hypothetical protein
MEDIQVLLDFSELDSQLSPERLEDITSSVADEIRGELVNKVELVRESQIPELSKPALAGFILGLLNAEVNAASIKTLVNYLGERFYGKTLKLEWEDKEAGTRIVMEYQNDKQLEQQLQAVERLSKFKITVVD